jgi:hypothetical protein
MVKLLDIYGNNIILRQEVGVFTDSHDSAMLLHVLMLHSFLLLNDGLLYELSHFVYPFIS